MSQAFVLPRGSSPALLREFDPEEIAFWQKQTDELANKKIGWGQFFAGLPDDLEEELDHPALTIMSSKGANHLLHLAVYQNQSEYIARLAHIPRLKFRRNAHGHTPLDLARYLNHPLCTSLLQTTPTPTFFNHPQIQIRDPETFQQLVSTTHLAHPIYESIPLFDLLLQKTRKAKFNDAIPSERIWMGVYFDKELQHHVHPKVSIRWIGGELGFGVFAAQRITPCTFIGEYTGVVRENKKKIVKDNDYCVRYTTWDMNGRFIIDAKEQGNFTRFINHSAKPNVGLQSIYWQGLPRMVFLSLKEIPEGEQLSFDYGPLFWKETQKIPLPLK